MARRNIFFPLKEFFFNFTLPLIPFFIFQKKFNPQKEHKEKKNHQHTPLKFFFAVFALLGYFWAGNRYKSFI